MAVTIIKQPSEISFSRNPNWWGFKTDNLYASLGTKSVFILSFPNGPLSYGNAFGLTYNNTLQTFNIKDYPDDSGLELLSGKDHPLIADMTLLEWCNYVISAFSSNFLISRDYFITLELTGPDPRVKLSSKVADSIYDLQISEQAFVNMAMFSNGVKKTRHPSFGIWMQLLVSNADHTGFDVVLTDTFLDVDDQGEAFPNLSQTLTQALIGKENDFEQPDPAMPAVQRNLKGSRQYYIRYAEAYGSKQAIRKISSTDTKWVILGGVGKAAEKDFDITGRFYVAGKHLFLKQETLIKTVKLAQCEWLSMVWLAAPIASLKLHIKVYFTAGDPAEFDAFTIATIAKYDKLTFPSGPTQLNLSSRYANKTVAYYEVWLNNPANERVSEIRTYQLAYEYQPSTRWFCCLSSLGGYDTFATTGKGSTEYELVTQKASITKTHLFKFEEGETLEFDSSLEAKATVLTGWIKTKRELKRYRDLFLSWNRFEIINGRAFPVMLNSKSINEHKDSENLFYLEFEVGYRFSDHAWTDDEEYGAPGGVIDISQFWPPVSNPNPLNWDHLYWRKTQTYNRTEIDAFITNVLTIENNHHSDQQNQIDALLLALNGKSNVDHLHEGIYVEVNIFNEAVVAIAAGMFYKGEWSETYSVATDDEETFPGYKLKDVVDYAGTLWRSLFGDDEELNTSMPGTDPAKWIRIINPKTPLTITEETILNWQAGLIPGKTYTWAQKYGNDLPGLAGAWFDNGSYWEIFDGFQLLPTYSGENLSTLKITADLYPIKINLI